MQICPVSLAYPFKEVHPYFYSSLPVYHDFLLYICFMLTSVCLTLEPTFSIFRLFLSLQCTSEGLQEFYFDFLFSENILQIANS